MYKIFFLVVSIALGTTACVQKTQKRVVVVTVSLQQAQKAAKVGIRGGGNPLTWENDWELTPTIADSVFTGSFVANTAYNSYEVKFTLNGEMELNNKPNRVITFATKGDTTFYKAIFNKP
jgi:hypothetical protein